jgi:hypothetical protein
MGALKLFGAFIIFFIFIMTISHSFLYPQYLIDIHTIIPIINKTIAIDFHPHIAVLVEFRTTDLIVTVVHNVNQHIPSTWPIQIFHGKENENFIRNSTLAPLIASGKIFLSLMEEVYGKNRTNELLTTRKFWERVRGEKVLFFQIDSIMCSNSPHKITDFLQYDYIGAPWDPSWFGFSKVELVGNGGFSLRSRSKLLALLAVLPYDRKMPEDVWYALNLRRVNGTVAPMNVAKTFAVESICYDRPLGAHRPYLKCSIQAKLSQTCPESMMVMAEKST